MSSGAWEYEPPLASDVKLLANIPNPSDIFRPKSVGEPLFVIYNNVYLATKSKLLSHDEILSRVGTGRACC